MILINISDISSLLSECKNMIPPPLMINMIIIRRTLRTWRFYIHTFIFIMYHHYYIMISTWSSAGGRWGTDYCEAARISSVLGPLHASATGSFSPNVWCQFIVLFVVLKNREINTISPSADSKRGSGSTSRPIATALHVKPRWLQSSLEILPILSSFSPWNHQLVLYSHWREQSCKTIDRVCFSCYNVCQWILKGEYSSWFNLGAKEFSSFVWCLGSFIDFLCAHAADTEGRDADSLVWLWQASHRF